MPFEGEPLKFLPFSSANAAVQIYEIDLLTPSLKTIFDTDL